MTRWPTLLKTALFTPGVHRRLLAGGATLLVHIALVWLILTVPLYTLPERAGRGTGPVDVRLYTVAGANAVTDAPLNEPPMAGEPEEARGGAEDASADQDGSGAQADTAEPEAREATDTPPESQGSEAERETPPVVETEAETDARLLAAPGSGNRALNSGERAAPPPPAPSAPADPDRPIATTQLEEPSAEVRVDRTTFAEILARADTGLDPADFVYEPVSGGVSAAVRESFCLASSDATREAGECPEGPNPNQVALAAYGLSEPGEVPPEFMIDLDRLAFQLAQMGANPAIIERVLLGFSEARREAVRSPTMERMMGRDELESGRDNLGVHNPFGKDGIPMPDNPGG